MVCSALGQVTIQPAAQNLGDREGVWGSSAKAAAEGQMRLAWVPRRAVLALGRLG